MSSSEWIYIHALLTSGHLPATSVHKPPLHPDLSLSDYFLVFVGECAVLESLIESINPLELRNIIASPIARKFPTTNEYETIERM